MKYKSLLTTLGLLIALLAMTFAAIEITGSRVLTLNFYANSGESISGVPGGEQVVYQSVQRWIYLFSAVYIIVKILTISVILSTALFLAGHSLPFRKIVNVVISAEFIFFLPALIKIICFPRVFPNGTLEDWHRFYPLSAVSLFGGAPADWIYPLQTLNLFELAYWFLLAHGICKISGLNYDRSLRLVVTSYVPALFVWVVSVTFFSLVMFPQTG